jgi:hypothetical protein
MSAGSCLHYASTESNQELMEFLTWTAELLNDHLSARQCSNDIQKQL